MSRETPAELLVRSSIITMDPWRPRAEAMLLRDGRIVAVGSRSEVDPLVGSGAERVEFTDGAIVPGLIDSHNHMLWTGLQTRLLDLSGSRSIAEIQQRIRAYGDQHPDASWIVSSEGWQVDDLAERRHPTRGELDAACADRPVYLPRIAHAAIANSAALAIAGVDEQTPDVDGGVIVREEGTRRPTGELLEAPAFELVGSHVPPPSEAERRAAMQDVQRRYHAVGLTGVIDPALRDDEIALYRRMNEDGELTVRSVTMEMVDTTAPPEEITRWIETHPDRTGQGDEWLRVGGLKVFMDGIVSMSSALLRDPYPDLPGTHGVQVTPSETLAAVARSCARSDWSLGVHLIGGAAIDRALEVFAEVDREVAIGNRRFSLIHAYLWPSAENISTAARLGVVAAVQAPMQEWIAPKLIARWGIDDAARATPMRSWLDGGVVLGGGSDSPLTPPDPLRGIAHSVTREVRGHGVVGPAQRITAGEALHSYTSAGAFLSFAEHERGTLRAGMLADWAALDVDPLQCRPDELGDATVSATCVGGAIVHARD